MGQTEAKKEAETGGAGGKERSREADRLTERPRDRWGRDVADYVYLLNCLLAKNHLQQVE